MDKRNISKVMIWETLFVALFSIGSGLIIGIILSKAGITATQESSLQTEDKESGTAPQTGIKNKIRRIWGWFVPPILATIYGLVAPGNLFSDGTDRLSGALLLCLLSIFITALASPVILALIGICKCIIRKIKQ